VALKENKDIFDAILKLMRKSIQAMVALPLPAVVIVSKDLDDMLVQPYKFIWKGKFNK